VEWQASLVPRVPLVPLVLRVPQDRLVPQELRVKLVTLVMQVS